MELRYIFDILWRQRWLVAGIFFSIFLPVVIGSPLITPWYDASAKLLIRKSSAAIFLLKSIGLSEQTTTSSTLSDTDREDYVALAGLRPVAEKTIAALDLKRIRTRARLMGAIPGLKTALAILGVNIHATEEVMTAEELLDWPLLSNFFPRPHAAVEQYEETDIIKITGKSTIPGEAVKIANSMAENFIQEELKRVWGDYSGVKTFIDAKIVKVREEYIESLKAVKEYKEKEKFLDLDTETSSLIEKIADFKKSLEENRVSIVKTKASIHNMEIQLKSMPDYKISSEELRENEMVKTLKTTLRDLYLNLAETKTRYKKEHPAVVDIENKIAQARELLQQESVRILGTQTTSLNSLYQEIAQKMAESYADLAGYESQDKALPVVLGRYESEMMKLPKKVAEYAKIQLASTVNQDIYSTLLAYQYQIGMAESAALSNVYLVESAVEVKKDDTKHKKPSLRINFVLALIFGFICGITGALFIDYLDDTIKNSRDIKLLNGMAFLGSILKLKKHAPVLIDQENSQSLFNEMIRTIRNRIKYVSANQHLKSLVVTSTSEREGKSFFVANLALSVANLGKKVLVIDGNLRGDGINNYFNLPSVVGLTDYISDHIELERILQKTDIDGLDVILSGSTPVDPGKIVEADSMHGLIKEMADRYDLVIVDTPAMRTASDALIFGGYTDGSILMVQAGRVRKAYFNNVIDLFKMADVHLLGVVLNRVDNDASLI